MRRLVTAIISSFAWAAISLAASNQEGPVLTSTDIPSYPPLARVAGIQGDVRLRVTTNGLKVTNVAVESGHPILATAAQVNARTWKFVKHKSTVFSTTFSYHLIQKSSCESDKPANDEVVFRLPSEVEVSGVARTREYCNPEAGLDLSEPLRVFLTECEIDGSLVPCQEMTIQLHSSVSTVTPLRFKDSKESQGFVVPKEFRSLKRFGVSVDTRRGGFMLPDVDAHLLKGKWRIGIDHAPFKQTTGLSNLSDDVRCVGLIHFQWGEPEPILWHACNPQ